MLNEYRVYEYPDHGRALIVTSLHKWHYNRGIPIGEYLGDLFSINLFNRGYYSYQYGSLYFGSPMLVKTKYFEKHNMISFDKRSDKKYIIILNKDIRIGCRSMSGVHKAIEKIIKLDCFS